MRAIAALLLVALPVLAEDPRFGVCPPERDASGRITRSHKVLADYVRSHPCPANGSKNVDDPCPGWALDHIWPRACGGIDSEINLQWLATGIKSCSALTGVPCKDRWERRVYGGRACSPGCP